MSFHAANGILAPEEVAVVRRVFSEIAAEDWFTRSEERREQFAASVIDIYKGGVRDPYHLSLQCRSLALVKFGSGGTSP